MDREKISGKMSNKAEQSSLGQNVVLACFEAVSKMDDMKNKWIDFDVWVEMIHRNTTGHSRIEEMISNLQNSTIKTILS